MVPDNHFLSGAEGTKTKVLQKIGTGILLLFSLLTGAVFLYRTAGDVPVVELEKRNPVSPDGHLTTMFYLHGNNFCRNCQAMRDFIQATLSESFGPELADKKLLFRVENFEAPSNSHFRSDFHVVADAVLLVEQQNGATVRWQPLSRFWELAPKKDDLRNYLCDEVRGFLSPGKKAECPSPPGMLPIPQHPPSTLWLAMGTAFALGLVAILSPCALATNLAAISFLGNSTVAPTASKNLINMMFSGIAYALGRVVAYVSIGFLIVAGTLSIPGVAGFTNLYATSLLGPLLIIAGLVLMGWLRLSWGMPKAAEPLQDWAEKGGILPSFLLGIVFAVAFCPMSAALFFGGLVPLAIKMQSRLLLPASFGLATGLPVLLFAAFLVFATRIAGLWFNRFREAGAWMRPLTGVLFVCVGLYFSLTYVFRIG